MANDKQTKSVEEPTGRKQDDAAADAELAAMAELASAPLREAQSKRKVKDGAKAKQSEKAKAKPKTTEDSVTLPIERTVKAFVKGISPSIEDMPPLSEDEDGISLDAALDDFMLDAKKVSTALPPPVVDDKQLADLARVPVATVEPTPVLPDEERKGTSLGNLILAAGLGAALAVGAVTLMRNTNRTTVPSTPARPPAAKAATTSTPTAAKLSATPATKTQEPDAAPAAATSTPDAAPAAATSTPDGAPVTAASKPDAAPAAAASKPDAAPKVVAKKKSTKPKKKVVRRKSTRVAKKRIKKKTRAKKKTTKKKTKKKKKKAGGGDWVDPFSR